MIIFIQAFNYCILLLALYTFFFADNIVSWLLPIKIKDFEDILWKHNAWYNLKFYEDKVLDLYYLIKVFSLLIWVMAFFFIVF